MQRVIRSKGDAVAGKQKVRWRLWWWVSGAVLALVALFAWNGLVLAHGQSPVSSDTDPRNRHMPARSTATADGRIRVLAWNLAKCFVYRGGLSFASRDDVESRLGRMVAVIRAENPDLVFLSEVVTECTPCNVDQVRFLSRETHLQFWVFGENYNFGLPFLRMVGGNAILSKDRLRPVGNPDLVGRKPFYMTRNNRRILFCRAVVAGELVLLGAMHTDSFDLVNNLRQTQQVLAFENHAPMLLAGDFNAEPDSASLAAVVGSGRFVGALHGPATYPAESPRRRIDYVFGPVGWKLIDSRVLDEKTSDHRPVVATFEILR